MNQKNCTLVSFVKTGLSTFLFAPLFAIEWAHKSGSLHTCNTSKYLIQSFFILQTMNLITTALLLVMIAAIIISIPTTAVSTSSSTMMPPITLEHLIVPLDGTSIAKLLYFTIIMASVAFFVAKGICKVFNATVQKHLCCAVCIQASIRGSQARKKFLQKKSAAVLIQSLTRGALAHKHFLKAVRASSLIQANWRVRFGKKKTAAACLQAFARGTLIRKKFLQKKRAAVLIQALTRGALAHKKFLCKPFPKDVVGKHIHKVLQSVMTLFGTILAFFFQRLLSAIVVSDMMMQGGGQDPTTTSPTTEVNVIKTSPVNAEALPSRVQVPQQRQIPIIFNDRYEIRPMSSPLGPVHKPLPTTRGELSYFQHRRAQWAAAPRRKITAIS